MKSMNKHHRKMCFRPGRASWRAAKSRKKTAFIPAGPQRSQTVTQSKKPRTEPMERRKENVLLFVGCFCTTHFHPGFSSFPCLKTSTQESSPPPFLRQINGTASPPLSLRFTHAAVKCREYTHERLQNKTKQKQKRRQRSELQKVEAHRQTRGDRRSE